MHLSHHLIPHHRNMNALHHKYQWTITNSFTGGPFFAGWGDDLKHKNSLTNLRIGPTTVFRHCWDRNYPGICHPIIASIQTNSIIARLERQQTGQPSHINRGCTRRNSHDIGSRDKVDDLSFPRTIFPVRGQYPEGPRACCLWSIRCRSSSKLHRSNTGSYRMVSLAVG